MHEPIIRRISEGIVVFRHKYLILLVVLLVALSGSATAAPLDEETYPAPGVQVLLGRYRMHIFCMGVGFPTVILDAGLGGTTLDWVKVQPEVAKLTRVCSYDRAGYGWSDRGPAPRTGQMLAMELRQLLDRAAEPAPYVVVGHSFGGLIARFFASINPSQIAGLVLIDATHEDQFERFEAAKIPTLAPGDGRRFIIANYYRIPDELPVEIKPVAQALALTPVAISALHEELRYMRLSARQAKLNKQLPDVPLVVIAHDSGSHAHSARARQMAKIWLKLQEELAARSSQGRLLVTQESGHYIHLEQPQIVIDAIRSVVEASRNNCAGSQLVSC